MIEEDLPQGFKGAFVEGTAGQDAANAFCRRLAEENLLTMSWPREFGGAEASIWEQAALREEMWAHHEPRGAQYMGLNWVGPSIMQFGTPGAARAAPAGDRHRQRRSGARASASPRRAPTSPRCDCARSAPTMASGDSAARRSGPPTPASRSGAS